MARFRIINIPNNGHYLNTIPPTEWEQVEVDQKTGRQIRHRYKVPMLLEPNDPITHNYPELGEIIVSTKFDPVYPRDIVFVGPPTTGMEPLDAEAVEIFARLPKGAAPMSEFALPSTGGFGPLPPPQVPDTSQLTSLLSTMQAQNAILAAQVEAMQRKLEELAGEKEEPLPDLVEVPPSPAVTQMDVRI